MLIIISKYGLNERGLKIVKRILLGIISVGAPIFTIVATVLSLFMMIKSGDEPIPENFHAIFIIYLIMLCASVLISYVLIIVFMIHATTKNPYIPQNKKATWAICLYLFNIFIIPIYWYRFLHKRREKQLNQ